MITHRLLRFIKIKTEKQTKIMIKYSDRLRSSFVLSAAYLAGAVTLCCFASFFEKFRT